MKAVYLTSIVLFVSCTKEVKIDIPQEESKIVIDGRIEIGGAPLVLLMQSQYLYNPTNLGAYFASNISDAAVTVVCGLDTFPLTPYLISELPTQSQITLAEQLNVELNELIFFPIKVYSSLDPMLSGEIGKSGEGVRNTSIQRQDNRLYGHITIKIFDPTGKANHIGGNGQRIKPGLICNTTPGRSLKS